MALGIQGNQTDSSFDIKNKKTRQEWILEKREKARELLNRMDDLVNDLFASSDLSNYLRLLCKMPYFSHFNLLLIYADFPDATLLAHFSSWEKFLKRQGTGMDSSSKPLVLNPDNKRPGIHLLAPFTEYDRFKPKVVWHGVLMFDISQINLQNPISVSPTYISDDRHLLFLSDALRDVICRCFGRSTVFDPNSLFLHDAGVLGQIGDKVVTIRKDLSDESTLLWLTEALCILTVSKLDFPDALTEISISDVFKKLLIDTASACLMDIWAIPRPPLLQDNFLLLPKHERLLFLDMLQRTVFQLYQQVAGAYFSLREEYQLDAIDFGDASEQLGW